MKKINWVVIPCVFLAIAGCGTVAKVEMIPNTVYQPHTDKVCFLKGGLDNSYKYTPLGRVVSTKRSYGGVDELYGPMAEKARSIGADAILNFHAGQRFKGPLPWRIVSPTGYGQAISLDDTGTRLDCSQLGGQLY